MEEILIALKEIKKDLDEQRQEIRATGINVTDKVSKNVNKMLEEKFLVWEKKYENLKKITENQEKRIYFLEKEARKRNIIFFGIEESEKSYENLENTVINWISQYLNIQLKHCDIQEVRRVGKKEERPRPIVVTFTTLGTKIKSWKRRNTLKDTYFYMKEDYPKYVLEKRKGLQEQLRIEREKGNTALLKYDKLIILPKTNTKRKLPTSPNSGTTSKVNETSQINKKNKIQKPGTPVIRSNSISEGVVKPGMLNFLVNKNTITASNHNPGKST